MTMRKLLESLDSISTPEAAPSEFGDLHRYQLRIRGASGTGDYEDIELESHDLNELASQFNRSQADGVPNDDVARIHGVVEQFHLGPNDSSVDEDYEVSMVRDDMLKVNYWFTSDNDRARQFHGELTILPGN